MKVRRSRLYYLPIYILCFIFLLAFPNIISLFFLFFVIIAIEIYISTHYIEIRKNNEIYIFEGIVNKKITKIEKELVNSVSLERNPYLYLLNLYTLKISSLNKEYKIEGIKDGDKIFKILTKSSKIQERF
ncbi:MAG: PH domain-containing protein [Candidatus Aenigmarchaeota archaeon]|nr:PH domain-containing protein [Candidatus Aenigmarchaeota archaeon]